LDAQRIHNLVTYLQELHSFGLANADHTTLINTYTKLKDVTRLDTFIKTESHRKSTNANGGDNGMDKLPFDLDTAMVRRQAGLNQVPQFLLLSGDGLYRSSGTGVGQLRPVLTGQKEKLREFRSHSNTTYLVINHRCKFSLFTPATPAGLIRRNLHNLFHCIYYNLACTKTIGGVRLPPPLPSNHHVAVFIIYLLNPISISSLEPILLIFK